MKFQARQSKPALFPNALFTFQASDFLGNTLSRRPFRPRPVRLLSGLLFHRALNERLNFL